MKNTLKSLKENSNKNYTDYDKIYDKYEGLFAYARQANTYKLRKNILKEIEKYFPNELSTKEINRIIKSQ